MNTMHLVELADRYAAHLGRSRSTVSTYAANDGKYFTRLEDGGNCTIRRANLLLQWFSDRWPDDLEWPAAIDRPKAKKGAA